MSERTKGYDIAVGEDMTKHGWVRDLIWLDVGRKGSGEWTLTEFLFDAGNYTCRVCKTNEFLWLVLQRNGVYLACTGCKDVEGPITSDNAQHMGMKTVSPERIMEVLKARGADMHWMLPAGLTKALKSRKAFILRRRRKRPTKVG